MVAVANTLTRIWSSLFSGLHRILAVIFCLLTAGLIVWYFHDAMEQHSERAAGESQWLARSIQSEVDAIFVRIKDLASFTAAGQVDLIQQKLTQATRGSVYLREMGFITMGEETRHESFYVKKSLMVLEDQQLEKMTYFLLLRPGLIAAFSPERYRSLFPTISKYDLILAQAMPVQQDNGLRLTNQKQGVVVSYAIFNLEDLFRDATNMLELNDVLEMRYALDGKAYKLEMPHLHDWLSSLMNADNYYAQAEISRDLVVTIELEEKFTDTTGLTYFSLGLVAMMVIAFALIGVFAKRGRQAQRELAQAVEFANRANEAKSEFLANMSHEIRTPLNGVLGIAEAFGRTQLNPAQKRYVEQIKSSGSLLLSILNDILDMSKLEHRQLVIDPVRSNLPSQLLETVTFFHASARKKQIGLLIDVDLSVPEYGTLDPMRLRQIIGNLVSNAIKFTPKGEVVVSVRFEADEADPDKGTMVIKVSDTGIGIGPEEISLLFNRFSQANAGMSRRFGGTGLGLSICRELSLAMGGSITADSSRGTGSTFTVCLPVTEVSFQDMPDLSGARVAVVGTTPTHLRLLTTRFNQLGASVIGFDYSEELVDHLVFDAERNGEFAAVFFEEGVDIEEAVMQWQRYKTKTGHTVGGIIMGERQLNKSYLNFDRALIKPFLTAQAAEFVDEFRNGFLDEAKVVDDEEEVGGEAMEFNGCRLLAVDDNQVNLMVVEELFAEMGFIIDSVESGAKAVSKAKLKSYDLILMDCQMPGMDGYQATAEIRELMNLGKTASCPIVALTANALKGDREKCLDAGMDDFVSKPLKLQIIYDLLERLKADPRYRFNLIPKTPRPTFTPERLADGAPALVAGEEAAMPPEPRQIEVPQETLERADQILNAQTAVYPDDEPQEVAEHQQPVLRMETVKPAASTTVSSPAPAPAPAKGKGKVPLMDMGEFNRTRQAMKKFDTLLSLYRSDTAAYLKNLRMALESGKGDEGVLPAHTIKSSSKIVGAVGLATLSAAMEERLRTGKVSNTADLLPLLAKMDQAFAATLRQIDLAMKSPAEEASQLARAS